MNTSSNHGPFSDADRPGSSGTGQDVTGEDTLRLIAGLPAPAGLEDRVKAGLRSSPGTGRVLMWRSPLWPAGGWMYSSVARGAAAAAIVCVVAGGGWRIYSRIHPAPAATVIVLPPGGNGFSNAGAVRVPETLEGPVLKHPVTPVPEVNVVKKAPAPSKAVTAGKKKVHGQPSPLQ